MSGTPVSMELLLFVSVVPPDVTDAEPVMVMLEFREGWPDACGRRVAASESPVADINDSRKRVTKCGPQRRDMRRELTGTRVPSIARKSISASSFTFSARAPISSAAELSSLPKAASSFDCCGSNGGGIALAER